jgi:N-acetylglucosamine kinase-like BadF-type ATPase
MNALIVDGGGTKTRAWLVDFDTRKLLDEVALGPSNISTLGEQGLRDALSLLAHKLSDPVPEAAVFGLAGVGRAAEAAQAAAICSEIFSESTVTLVTDAQLAYHGAFARGRHGILLIAGTGTIALYQNPSGHEYFRAGGWGPLLGDEGSGNWLGREVLRHCLREWEKDELTAFHEKVLEALEIETAEEILTKVYHNEFGPGKWATLAPLIFSFAKTDDAVMRILRRAVVHLVALAERLIEDLPQSAATLPLVITGGLWEQREILEPLIQDEIKLRNLPLLLAEPEGGPLEGGLAILKKNLSA